MTLHTTMPLELVFHGMDKEQEPLQEIWAGGVRMQIVPIAPGMGRIVRLLDCSLDDYLNPELTPGNVICFGRQS
ncbi:YlzJ-like family protein [Paenibacillus sp. GCM10027627]|uniref:YlzJ-like family protein n=1 Tax=unclassified Paenibacillus TaxID=185978 RepID=UPI00362FB9EA